MHHQRQPDVVARDEQAGGQREAIDLAIPARLDLPAGLCEAQPPVAVEFGTLDRHTGLRDATCPVLERGHWQGPAPQFADQHLGIGVVAAAPTRVAPADPVVVIALQGQPAHAERTAEQQAPGVVVLTPLEGCCAVARGCAHADLATQSPVPVRCECGDALLPVALRPGSARGQAAAGEREQSEQQQGARDHCDRSAPRRLTVSRIRSLSGLSFSPWRQIRRASSCLPSTHSTSPRCAATSWSGNASKARCR